MTSKLVVNTIEADTGISSVSFASSISLSSTSVFHLGDAGFNIGADTNISRAGNGILAFNINSSEKVRINSTGDLQFSTGSRTGNVNSICAANGHSLDFNGTEYLYFRTAATERLRIKSNGYVGVNETNPQYPLHVAGATTTSNPTGTGILMGLQHDHALIHLNAADTKGSIIDFTVPGADRRGGILYYHSNNPTVADRDVMKFVVNSSNYGMEIKSNGIVTKPLQPGFFAYMDGGNQTTNGNNIIPFNQTHFNTGSHFKTSGTHAHKFVCPVAGIYHFSGAIWMKNSGTGAHARWQIRKNDVIQIQAGWHQNSNNSDFFDHSAPASISIYCDAGDRVHAHADYTIQYWRGGSSHPHTYFSGHLVG